jgi:hypothetical protein
MASNRNRFIPCVEILESRIAPANTITTSPTVSLPAGNDWQLMSITATAPTGAVTVQVRLVASNGIVYCLF